MLRIEFASTKFTGSESSGEVLVSIVVTGIISNSDISVRISLTEGTAKG